MMSPKMIDAVQKIMREIGSCTTKVARLSMSMDRPMSTEDQAETIVQLALAGVDLAKATATLIMLGETHASGRTLDAESTERKVSETAN